MTLRATRAQRLAEAEELLEQLGGRSDLSARHRSLAARNLRYCRALRHGDPAERLPVYVELAVRDALNPALLREIRHDLGRVEPGQLNEKLVGELAALFEEQAAQLERLRQAGILER